MQVMCTDVGTSASEDARDRAIETWGFGAGKEVG
jgi:hypothetical protein